MDTQKELAGLSKGVHGGHLFKNEELYLINLQETIITTKNQENERQI